MPIRLIYNDDATKNINITWSHHSLQYQFILFAQTAERHINRLTIISGKLLWLLIFKQKDFIDENILVL